ncbi:MAG: GDSL family lipase [Fibrella sp.]|nr:GDSL family lipase [Armatimonadota bacterium]
MLYCARFRGGLRNGIGGSVFEWYEAEVSVLEAKAAAMPVTPGSVLFYGSSSVRLWETLPADIGPLTGRPGRDVVNLGFGGSTLASCVHYFDRLPGRVARESPPVRSLVFYAGENDLGDGRSVDTVFDSFVWLHAMVRDRLPGVPFAFISIKPSPARAPVMNRIRAVNDKVRERILERPESLFIDVYSEMLNENGTPRLELWAEDGIHMSRAGYDLWTQILTRYRVTLFE